MDDKERMGTLIALAEASEWDGPVCTSTGQVVWESAAEWRAQQRADALIRKRLWELPGRAEPDSSRRPSLFARLFGAA